MEPGAKTEGLTEQLHLLSHEDHENRRVFLGRAALLAEDFGEQILTDNERRYVNRLVPAWQFDIRRVRAKEMSSATRPLEWPATTEQQAVISEQREPNRRLVAIDESQSQRQIVLLSSLSRLAASDLASIFKIEQVCSRDLEDASTESPHDIQAPGKPHRYYERAEKHEASGLLLVANDIKILRLIALPTKQIVAKTGMGYSTIAKSLQRSAERNIKAEIVTDKAAFLDLAIKGGLVDMGLLPAPRFYELSPQESALVRDHVFDNLTDTAKELGYRSTQAVTALRNTICNKLGLTKWSPNHVVLVLKRDDVL